MRCCLRRRGRRSVGDDGLIRRSRPLLGTLVEISVPAGAIEAIEPAFSAIGRVHRLMSFHEAGSDLARLREAAAGSTTPVATETAEVLRAALELHRISGGIFDIAVGYELVRSGFLPRAGLRNLHHYAGTTADISVLADDRVYQHRVPLLDLGGIAKGYAVDCAVEVLMAQGVSHGIVNAGGDLRVFGTESQPVAVRLGNGSMLDFGCIARLAVATSENRNVRRRHRAVTTTPHIGRNGEPVRIDGAVSTCARSCMMADAMTKVAAVDPDLAQRLLAPHGGRVLLAHVGSGPAQQI
jgi:FAD:protein FMN transferase